MKTFILYLTLLMLPAATIYDFKINSLEGELIDFSQYKGKTLLIVNTASACGFTPQYKDLEQLHETYGNKVTILGFPANNFGSQEPGSNLQIAEFCQKNYGVKFQMFEKVSVKGDDQHPLYAYLKEKTGQEPTWNFCKYIVKPDGTVKFFPTKVKPMDQEILDAINWHILNVVVKSAFSSMVSWFGGKKSSELKESIYDYTANTIDGREIHLSKYQGRPLMIVNTASNCGFTSQYAGLQELHKKYGDRITILGFPSNNFMWQEPGSNKSIASFCALNYGVTFQMFEKISVKGRGQHPIFHWLEVHAKNRPTWNFCKYLIDKKGKVVAFYPAKVDPLDPELAGKIQSML